MSARESNDNGYASDQVKILAKQSGPVNIEEIKKKRKFSETQPVSTNTEANKKRGYQTDTSQSQTRDPAPESDNQERDCVPSEEDKNSSPKYDAVDGLQSEETSISLPEPEFRNVAGHVRRRTDIPNDVVPQSNASGSRQTPANPLWRRTLKHLRRAGRGLGGEGSGSESEGDGRNPSKNDDAATTKRRKQTPAEQEHPATILQPTLQQREKEERQRLELIRELGRFQRLSETTRQCREANRKKLNGDLAVLKRFLSGRDGICDSYATNVDSLRSKILLEDAQRQEYLDDALYGYIIDNTGADEQLANQTRHSFSETVFSKAKQQIEENILRRYHRFDTLDRSNNPRVRIHWIIRTMFEASHNTEMWHDGIVPEMEVLGQSTDAVFHLFMEYRDILNTSELEYNDPQLSVYPEDYRFYDRLDIKEFDDYLRRTAVLQRLKTIHQFRDNMEITNVNIQQGFCDDHGAVSLVLSKSGSLSAIKQVAHEDLRRLGWCKDERGQPYWRHAFEGQMIYKITMDEEVLGAYSDGGTFFSLEYAKLLTK